MERIILKSILEELQKEAFDSASNWIERDCHAQFLKMLESKLVKQAFEFNSVNTVRDYVEYLSETYLINQVSGYSAKVKERSTLQKKIYACDTGMIASLGARPTPDLGSKLETVVFLELKRRGFDVYYWRTGTFDIDFLACRNGIPVEIVQVCYSLSSPATREREITSAVKACHAIGMKVAQIVTLDESSATVINGVEIVTQPAWEFCLNTTLI